MQIFSSICCFLLFLDVLLKCDNDQETDQYQDQTIKSEYFRMDGISQFINTIGIHKVVFIGSQTECSISALENSSKFEYFSSFFPKSNMANSFWWFPFLF